MTPLDRVRALAAELAALPWFTACGTALTRAEQEEAARYLEGLDLPPADMVSIPDWQKAGETAQRGDWSRAWWAAEDRAAKALQTAAAGRWGEAALLEALSAVTEAAAALHEPAVLATARAGATDPRLSRVAAGAAALACHQAGLASAADAPEDHPLLIKYRLFAGGHWLLGLVGGRCYLF